MPSNFDKFFKDIQKQSEDELKKQQDKAKNIIAEAYTFVIKESEPSVDTSLYISSHFISVNKNDNEVINPKSKEDAESLANINKSKQNIPVFKWKSGDTIRIYNNTIYAEHLENSLHPGQRMAGGSYARASERARQKL